MYRMQGMGAALAKPVPVNMMSASWVQELKRAMNAVSPGTAGHTPVWYPSNGDAWVTRVAPILAQGAPVSRLTAVSLLNGSPVNRPSPLGLALLAQRLGATVGAYPTLRLLVSSPAQIYPSAYGPAAPSQAAESQRGVGEYFAPMQGMGEYFAANGLGVDPPAAPPLPTPIDTTPSTDDVGRYAIYAGGGAILGFVAAKMLKKGKLAGTGVGAILGFGAAYLTPPAAAAAAAAATTPVIAPAAPAPVVAVVTPTTAPASP